MNLHHTNLSLIAKRMSQMIVVECPAKSIFNILSVATEQPEFLDHFNKLFVIM